MKCPACGAEVPGDGQFCGHCRAALTTPCPLCGRGNRLGIRFCEGCGAEVGLVTPGLSMDRAVAWREQLTAMLGWDNLNEDPFEKRWRRKGLPGYGALLETAGIPKHMEDPDNYFVISCRNRGSRSDNHWKINDIRINGRPTNTFWGNDDPWYLIGTRCRFIVVSASKSEIYHWLYRDIAQAQIAKGNYNISFGNGDTLMFSMKTSGAPIFNYSVKFLHGASNVVSESQNYIASMNIGNAKRTREEFISILNDFVSEVAEVGTRV